MRTRIRRIVVLALVGVALATTGCSVRGCSSELAISIRPAATTVAPGRSVTIRAVTVEAAGSGSAHETTAQGRPVSAATWSAEGPGRFTLTKSAPDVAEFVADAPGVYVVTVHASAPSDLVATSSVTVSYPNAASAAGRSEQSTAAVAPDVPTIIILDTTNGAFDTFDTFNGQGIRAGGSPPTVQLTRPATVAFIQTYHYRPNGVTAAGSLGLQGADGTLYGPWQATGSPAPDGARNAYWTAQPNTQLPAGSYVVIDSGPGTWSTNDTAKGVGFTKVGVIYNL